MVMPLGGWLMVLDRNGRVVKDYRLRVGSVTLGSDPACDIRVMVPTVSPHHATVSALYHQTVVRNVSERETLVNGTPVSVAALRHGDVITLGGRSMRWEYRVPGIRRPLGPEPALLRRVPRGRVPRRGSEPAPRSMIVPDHRASMPASSTSGTSGPSGTSGKQVAIVQPQRRDTSDVCEPAPPPRLPPNKRPRVSRTVSNPSTSAEPVAPDTSNAATTKRKSTSSPRDVPNLSNTTKATLWIESRKTSPRKSAAKTQTTSRTPVKTPAARRNMRKAVSAKKSTPLRMVVLKKAQSAQKMKVTKIQAPLKMDSTKQAAIMLMTRHTPKSKQTSPNQGNKGPSFVVKKPSPVKDTSKKKRASGKRTLTTARNGRSSNLRQSSARISYNRSSVIEITDSETQPSTRESSVARRSGNSSQRSPHLMSPKKSALKDPNAKKSNRKSESIKFDLSNLNNASLSRSSDVMLVNDTENNSCTDDSETDFTLRFSDSSKSPSPRKSINSRSRRMLESTLGTSLALSPKSNGTSLTVESPQTKKCLRGSIILQEALRINKSDGTEISTYSRRTTKSVSDQSWSTTIASTRRTRTLSPRSSRNLESYSVVDLVSIDSNDSTTTRSGSVYTSADSNRSYDTPGSQNLTSISRRALGCSTPYELKSQSPECESLGSSTRIRKFSSRVSNRIGANTDTLITTPENTEDTTKNITLNSTKISRASKKRFRIVTQKNALIFMDEDVSDDDSSPKSSKRISKGSQASPLVPKNISVNETFVNSPSIDDEGMHTPENRHSPVEASTPMLNIQSLLNASQSSNQSPNARGRRLPKRNTVAALRSEPRQRRIAMKAKSLSVRRFGRGREVLTNLNASDDSSLDAEEEVVTPKSAAKPFPEGVKNKHSSAKKPQSKRSLIDNLNESDIVKQLFNSPVKRKLSQSMTEFSRRHLFDDDEDSPRRPTRATIAVAGTSRDRSLLDHTDSFTPEIFVSPLNTPRNSPNMAGIKRLFQKNTPDNDLRNIRGVKGMMRTPRTRKSVKNDLTNVSGVKAVFARSPRNRLSDVSVKNVFAASPKNDLRRVTGVKTLFKPQRRKGRSPRNELDDFRGVRTLFTENSPSNDLRNVSGVKRALQRNSPRNDLTDVRGVRQMFRQEKQTSELSDVSGVERLFHESANLDSTFDQLLGRPPIRAVYTRSKSFTTTSKIQKRGKNIKSKSLHDVSLITHNVEEWLQKELTERLHKNPSAETRDADTSTSKTRKSLNKSRSISKTMRELQKLNTDTVNGSVTVIANRTRNSSILTHVADQSSQKKSASELYGAHTLPIKKRSLVEAATNRSVNDRSHKLPIKKRAVVHSTPVKGRVNMTMNASEIGRMSPISSEEKLAEPGSIVRSPQRQVSYKTRSPLAKTKLTEEISLKEKSVEIVKLSPKKTRSLRAVQGGSTSTKTRRGRKPKADNQEVSNIKKRRSSVVIAKRAPVASPKPRTRKGKSNLVNIPDTSPKKTRSTRGHKSPASREVKTFTPKKNTRAKAARKGVVVTKPSPKLIPRVTTADDQKDSETEQPPLRTKRSRKVTIVEPEELDNKKNKRSSKEAKAEIPSKRKSRKMISESGLGASVVDKSLSVVQTRRTHKSLVEAAQTGNSDEKSIAQTKRIGRVAVNKVVEDPQLVAKAPATAEPASRRSRRTKDVVVESSSVRGRRTAGKEPKSVTKDLADNERTDKKSTRGRKVKQEVLPEVISIIDLEQLPAGRGRKRKITEREDPVTKNTTDKKDKGRTKKTENADNIKSVGRQKIARGGAGDSAAGTTQPLSKADSLETGTKTRGSRQAIDAKAVRGRQTTSMAEGVPLQAGGRKKRTNVEVSDAKENKKELAKKPRKAATTSPAVRALRARGTVASAASGRGRRR